MPGHPTSHLKHTTKVADLDEPREFSPDAKSLWASLSTTQSKPRQTRNLTYRWLSVTRRFSTPSHACSVVLVAPNRLLCLWNSPGKNTGAGATPSSRGSFQPREKNPGLLHCRQVLYPLSHQGSPYFRLFPGHGPDLLRYVLFRQWPCLLSRVKKAGITNDTLSFSAILGLLKISEHRYVQQHFFQGGSTQFTNYLSQATLTKLLARVAGSAVMVIWLSQQL